MHDQLHVYMGRPTVLTIGVFDGVHLGHQHLLGQVRERALELGCASAVITVHPHPQQVLSRGFKAAYLLSLEDRVERLRDIGLDVVAVLDFNEAMARTPAREFIRQLSETFRLAELCTGPDFALGRNREGNLASLRELGGQLGFKVNTASPLVLDGLTVSSTSIRRLLSEGDVKGAAAQLGRPPTLRGHVVPGSQRGRLLGMPTANLGVGDDILLPGTGIYAGYARIGSDTHRAAIYIGSRPTFGETTVVIEAFLLDFQGDIYGQVMTLEFCDRLRGDQRFPNADALVAQMQADVAKAKEILR